MSIRLAGPLPITEITAEFGGTTPHALSEYYADGSFLIGGWAPKTPPVPNKGSSLPMSVFYGKGKKIPITITIAANETNVDVFSKFKTAVANYANVDISATLIINSGVTVYGSGGSTALKLTARDSTRTTGFKSTDDVIIENNGNIIGQPGTGGAGGTGNTIAATAGSKGGTAILLSSSAIIRNSGTIAGGADGGNGGSGGITTSVSETYCLTYTTSQQKQAQEGVCNQGTYTKAANQYCDGGNNCKPCGGQYKITMGRGGGGYCLCQAKGPTTYTQKPVTVAMSYASCNPRTYSTTNTGTVGGAGGPGATCFSNVAIAGAAGGGGSTPVAQAGGAGKTWGNTGLWIQGYSFVSNPSTVGGTILGGAA